MCTYLAVYEVKNGDYIQTQKDLDKLLDASHIFIRNGVSVILSGSHAQHVQNNFHFILGNNLQSLIVVHVDGDYALEFPRGEHDLQTDMEMFFPPYHSRC